MMLMMSPSSPWYPNYIIVLSRASWESASWPQWRGLVASAAKVQRSKQGLFLASGRQGPAIADWSFPETGDPQNRWFVIYFWMIWGYPDVGTPKNLSLMNQVILKKPRMLPTWLSTLLQSLHGFWGPRFPDLHRFFEVVIAAVSLGHRSPKLELTVGRIRSQTRQSFPILDWVERKFNIMKIIIICIG